MHNIHTHLIGNIINLVNLLSNRGNDFEEGLQSYKIEIAMFQCM